MEYPATQVANVGTIVMGQSPPGAAVGDDPAKGLPLLNGPTEFGLETPVPRQWTSEWSREAQPGDTLFCVRGSTTGRMNIAQTHYAIGRGIAAVRGETPLDTNFIRYGLEYGLQDLLLLTSGSVFPNISTSDLKAFEIPWPPMGQRAAVVSVIAAIDRCVRSNRRIVKLIGEFLDVYSSVMSVGLPSISLGKLVSVSRIVVDPSRNGDQLVDLYSLPSFDLGARPERIRAASIMSSKLSVSQRSILLSRLNPKTNRTWWMAPRDVPALASSEFSCLTARSDEELAGVWLAVRDEFFRTELTRRVTGTSGSHQRVRPEDVLSIEVPDVRELDPAQRASILAALNTTEKMRDQIDLLSACRKALLPELVSGRLRVPDAEQAMEEAIA